MKDLMGSTGLILNEPLLWEKGKKGRIGFSLPNSDVPSSPLAEELIGAGPDFPDLSEVDVVRHYTHLSTWNFGVDSGMYPLGSCTMKYNPKTNERQASLPGLAQAHPLLPPELAQGVLRIMFDLEKYLAEITGLPVVTVQIPLRKMTERHESAVVACRGSFGDTQQLVQPVDWHGDVELENRCALVGRGGSDRLGDPVAEGEKLSTTGGVGGNG